jgi:hypothetical protein
VVGEGGRVGPPHAAADADRAYVNYRASFRRGLENG